MLSYGILLWLGEDLWWAANSRCNCYGPCLCEWDISALQLTGALGVGVHSGP